MNNTMLNNFFFEKTVSLNLGFSNGKYDFFCDGFVPFNIINSLPYSDDFQLTDFFFEFGIGETYKCIEYKDVEKITDFNSFKQLLISFEQEVYIFKLKFSLGIIDLIVDDDKEISFLFEKEFYQEAKNIFTNLIVTFFNFSQMKGEDIFSLLENNLERYLEINEKGETISISKDFPS